MGQDRQFGQGHNFFQMQNQAQQLAKKLAAAEKEDEKKDLRKKLTDVLNQQFDAHAKEQEKELDDLEKQVSKLRETLKKRQANKDKIVERHIDQMVQDAEGLGWSTPSSAPRAPGALGGGFGGFGGTGR